MALDRLGQATDAEVAVEVWAAVVDPTVDRTGLARWGQREVVARVALLEEEVWGVE